MRAGRGDTRGGFGHQLTIHRKLLVLVFLLASLAVPTGRAANANNQNIDCNTFNGATGGLPPDHTWAPSYFYVEAGQLDPDTRYLFTEVVFADTSGFGLGSTYEQDFAINNEGGSRSYFTLDETLTELPATQGWDSNLPEPYLDTRFKDDRNAGENGPDSGERRYPAYTIGSADAVFLEPNTLYYTIMYLDNGMALSSQARLDAQLGCLIPLVEIGTWTSFYAKKVPLVSEWGLQVPGSASGGSTTIDDTDLRASLGLPAVNTAPAPDTDIPIVPVPDPPTTDTGEIGTEIVEPDQPISDDSGNGSIDQPVIEQPAPTEPEPQQPQATLDLSVQRWCEDVYSPNSVANYLDYGDPYSWVCDSNGVQGPVDMQDMAERQYGPGYCAYIVGPTAYDWKAGSCL